MRGFRRRDVPDVAVDPGEKVLAHATSPDGPVAGTGAALYLPDGHRIPWESIEAADWDLDSTTFKVSEVGTWGEQRAAYALTLDEPDRLLQLVRERVTATILLQRHVAMRGTKGVRVIARRAPTGERRVTWLFEYDEGIDPDDPFVAQAAQEALLSAREEVGDR
ncbi:hypothetical protein G5V58_08210 [Nocardioides anomalus]|uniref:Uncharacterized protein n=1 Tax=Nocardioides anomalus TaxID=2712223 RepID=A0A6G6WBR1_9ACTN|nr:hypothetical protein [Nocardioides anomalus]QIG42768.1 hypothetical protein G5V58_08210 [Nocardioides anomalus]